MPNMTPNDVELFFLLGAIVAGLTFAVTWPWGRSTPPRCPFCGADLARIGGHRFCPVCGKDAD